MLILGILLLSFSFVLPKTNFYKNIETHLDYLKLDHITDVFQEEEFIDHFIFSQRLTFLRREGNLYHKASIYQKLFGIGYLEEGKPTKLVEMDYFDIYFHHGIFGFVLYFSIIFVLLFKIVRQKNTLTFSRYMLGVSIWYAIILSFFTGHIMTAPSVSFLLTIMMVSFEEKKKKRLLFTAVSLDLGGIERALLNLVNRINLKKYEVEIILEEKKSCT